MLPSIIFWLSAILIFHSYVLYPLLLQWLGMGKKENQNTFETNDENLPEVIVAFSVFNEEKVIRQKLESIFSTTYPLNKLQIFIGSDHSTDATNHIVNEFTHHHPQLNFFKFEGRNGKAGVLNKLAQAINETPRNSEQTLLILTDANVMFTPQTIYELVKHFKEEKIAQVGATILNQGEKKDGISMQEKGYIQRENKVKYLEGLNWGTMIGAFGACYALRMSLWKPIPPNYLMEDFYLSMNVLLHHKSAILEPKAICYEDVSDEVTEEFKRKTRIQAGNFQNLEVYWPILFRFDATAFCFFSHKVIRWFGPLLIALCYISNFFLLNHAFYQFTFLLQNMLFLSPVLDRALKQAGVHLTILRFASYFIIMNIALVQGFLMYARGIRSSVWQPTKRNV